MPGMSRASGASTVRLGFIFVLIASSKQFVANNIEEPAPQSEFDEDEMLYKLSAALFALRCCSSASPKLGLFLLRTALDLKFIEAEKGDGQRKIPDLDEQQLQGIHMEACGCAQVTVHDPSLWAVACHSHQNWNGELQG